MRYPYVDLGFFLHQLRALKMLIHMSTNVNTCQQMLIYITLFDASSTADSDPIEAFKSYDETDGSVLFPLPMLRKNVEDFVSFLLMIFVFNFRMIFIFLFFVQF